ncbi:hypothetical protein DTO166G4_6908 [Paecilomyces variotii]|nr:hypothetical protein DTO166G4_6908 [Paecilomyces variotii]KAJ9237695.1 hypothetical protein DTO166G5_3459 [Paecilomyces variotii]KAJ9238955.1 hypothetical protein DTO169E5_4553 [Paecilomyces variotii]KAJ9261266.1 hypothetical protein DTO195F2_4292 [Paecilomyces variotii]KAJ9372843.1 hypothetical protein DTO282E5_2570 [Paecilomyces variotii]
MWMKTLEKLSRGSSAPSRKIGRLLIASLLVASCLLLWNNFKTSFNQSRLLASFRQSKSSPQPPLPHSCNATTETIERYQLTRPVQFLRREIIASRSSSDLKFSEPLDAPLFDYRSANLTAQLLGEQTLDACSHPLTVPVPTPPAQVDASHIDFGVATTYDRLYESLDQFAHWAGNSNARIFALIEPHGGHHTMMNKAQSLGINLHIVESDIEYNARYFSLLRLLEENALEETEWSCIIDDDTFFLSMPALVKRLDQYDSSKPLYIGGLSESVAQIAVFGIMGFGGAGVFVSRPLLDQLSEVFAECQAMEGTGDKKISQCIYQHTSTKFIDDQGLRQLDLMDDASGFFEAGREQPLSVHHWKSWYQADMIKLATISKICGDTCLLRQWRFSDDWILTNGYSIVKRSREIAPGTMERTWTYHNGAVLESYFHALGPLEDIDPGKISYRMEDSIIEEDGRVRQFYIHRDDVEGDRVIELVWRSE